MPVLYELKDLVIQGVTEQLNLQLEPGACVVLITAGDQESTLLFDTLLGEAMPDAGSVLFEEQCLHTIDRSELMKIRRAIAAVAPGANLISNLKVWENITLHLMYHNGSVSPAATELALQLLEEADLLQNQWSLPGHLSAAERILIAFIRAAVSEPRLVLYAACLDDLPGRQRERFLKMATRLLKRSDAPAALFITTGSLQLTELQPALTIDLRQNPALVMRRP